MLFSRSSARPLLAWMLLGLSPSLFAQQHFSPINSTCPTEVILGSGACGGAPGGGAGLPAGLIVLSLTSCPAGYVEETSLNGKFVLGTLAANGDVTGTGGSDSITSVLNHTHTVSVTDPGHTHTLPVGATDDTAAPFDRADAGTNTSGANATTASGSNTTGITATTANPAGGVASIDNRPAFVRVIFCKKS